MERWQGHWQLAEIGDGMQWHGKDNTDDRQHHDANQRRRDGVGQPRQEIDYGQACRDHCVGVPCNIEHLRYLSREDEDCQRINKRSEEHTSELQSLMRISYAVFCLKKQT